MSFARFATFSSLMNIIFGKASVSQSVVNSTRGYDLTRHILIGIRVGMHEDNSEGAIAFLEKRLQIASHGYLIDFLDQFDDIARNALD